MKRLTKLLILSLSFAAVTGCIREQMEAPVTVPQMTICATVPEEPLTKASFTVPDSGTGLHLAWQAGDKIRVISGSNSAVYNIQTPFTDHVARFTGPVVSGDTFDIIAPGTYESVAAAEAGNPNLTQTGNGSTAHLVFTAKLSGVSSADLPNITFSDDWVSEHPGTSLKKGGILKLILTLPDGITAPKRVVLSEIGSTELGVNSLSLNIEGVSLTTEHVLTAYLQCGWDDIDLAKRSYMTIGVMDGDGTYYTKRQRLGNNAKVLMAGAQNIIALDNTEWNEQLFAGGNGSQATPYLIANAKHLDNMHSIENDFRDGKISGKFYFRLLNDIDMQSYLASNDWVPLNMLSPYELEVDLDGDGHTIDNFSITSESSGANQTTGFFGVLYGSAHDLTFTNAYVNNKKNNMTGILCAYCGYKGKVAHVYNVHVNGTVRYSGSGNAGVGGLAGVVYNCLLESSSAFDIDVLSTKNYNGGLFGRDDNAGCTIRNCWTSGQVGSSTDGTQRKGGICGGLIKQHTTIINCFSTAKVLGTYCMGGIAGHCNLDKGSNDVNNENHPKNKMPYNIIQGCIAWNDEITSHATDPTNDHYSSGAIMAYGATHNYLANCGYKSGMSFKDYNDWVPYTQADANPSTPLVVNTYSGMNYHYPYHGKYAFTGSLSAAAKTLGWNETVWDLSGSIPVLTGAIEPEPSSGASGVAAGSSNGGPKYPSAGNGWTVNTVEDGVKLFVYDNASTYSSYTGSDDFEKRHQNVFVVDLDLSNPNYKVKLVSASPACALSQVFDKTSAVAAINAGYEVNSIALKVNAEYTWTKANADLENNVLGNIATENLVQYPAGLGKSYMPNNTIGDTGVPNWKSQGTFYCDGERGIRFAFDGYDPAKAPGGSGNPPVKSILDERLYYQLFTEDEPGFVSSAPVLIENYNAVGKQFKTWYPKVSGEDGEAPNTHQTGVYPRTAVALMGDNHLLLIAVDGRYTASAGGEGMSAYWLTQFLVKYFNPQYALNLDGGGSTTMCVEGSFGDASTHVVNYPCDNRGNSNNIHNHDGQRARDSFICIVRTN